MLASEGDVAGEARFMLSDVAEEPEGDEATVAAVEILGSFLDDGVTNPVGRVGNREQFGCLCCRCLLLKNQIGPMPFFNDLIADGEGAIRGLAVRALWFHGNQGIDYEGLTGEGTSVWPEGGTETVGEE